MSSWMAVTTVFVALALAPPIVRAHGGTMVYLGAVGPYEVRVDALLEGGLLDYTLAVRLADTGEVVTNAVVTLRAEQGGKPIGTWTVPPSRSFYELVVPVSEPVRWGVDLRIEGSAGVGELHHRLAVDPPEGWLWPSLVGLAVLIVMVGGHMAWRRIRRHRPAEV